VLLFVAHMRLLSYSVRSISALLLGPTVCPFHCVVERLAIGSFFMNGEASD
jgi:hypothetical protein